MKINGPGKIPGTNPYQKATRFENKQINKHQQDEVQISSEAHSLLAQELNKEEKIQKLKEEVQSGTYQVKTEQLAEKLMQYWKNQL